MRWPEICGSDAYRGRWVALDHVRYDPAGSQPVEAEVVDADEDLAELCARMRGADRSSCAVLFCDPEDQAARPNRASEPPPSMTRPNRHPHATR